MPEPRLLLLKTTLYNNSGTTMLHECFDEMDQSSTLVVDPATMQVADWDQVLQKILDHDQCLTL